MSSRRPSRSGFPLPRLRALLALAAVAAVACVQGGAGMPAVSPSGTLRPDAGESGRGADGPFRVVFSGPSGDVATGAEISIVFSRALRKLELAGSEATPPVTLTPALAGRWQWVGTQALVFVPASGRLPGATRITVEVPAATRALDGATLGSPHRFELTTPRPKLVRSHPGNGARGIEPKTPIELFFNQPMDPEKVRRASKLGMTRAGKTQELAFEVKRPDPTLPKRLLVVPSQGLPVHASFRFTLAESLTSEEGPLPAGEVGVVAFETYGPLAIDRINCNHDTPHGDCAPGGSLGVSFTNPVRIKDVKRTVSLTPAADVRWETWRDDDDLTTWADLSAKLRPGQTYTLRVGGELTDKYGQRLGRAFTQKVKIDDLWPTVEIGIAGDTLESTTQRPVQIGAVNVASYELATVALTPGDVLSLGDRERPEARWARLLKIAGKARTVRPGVATNLLAKETVDPARVLPGSHRGAMAVGIRYVEPHSARESRAPEPRSDVRLIQVTDLAISAKLSRHGSLVWVSRLSNGAPVANARVELHRAGLPPKSYDADAQGIATIPVGDYRPDFHGDGPDAQALLVARSGDDWAFRRATDQLDAWRFGVPTDLSGEQRTYGLMFTERGIYRPGDTVQVKGIVRSEVPTGNAVPSGTALELVLSSPDGEEVSRRTVTTNRFGTFDAGLKVPRSAALGSWGLRADRGKIRVLGESFEVAEYRPAEFKVSAESNRPEYVRGDTASWTARADYLFGAPMSKAAVRYNIQRGTTWFTPPGSDDFVTDGGELFDAEEDESSDAATLRSEQGKLDEKGQLATSAKLELPGQRGPEIVTLDAEVTDVSRQALSGSTSAIVHPASFYLGLARLDQYFVDAPGQVKTGVVALSPKAERLAGKQVKVELVRRKWTLARQETGGGRYHSVSKPVDTVLGACEVVTARDPVPCSLAVPEGGLYLLVARAADERKNPVRAAQSFFGIGPGGSAWRDSDKAQLELALNKKQYRVGETARVLVKSPFPEAEALVTVERAGVYRTQRTKLVGPTPTVQIPITDQLRPNAFVSVHLVRGRSKAAPAERSKADVGAPQYRVGYAELTIDPEARRLKVDVRPVKGELGPGQTAEVEVRVRDGAGKPKSAEVTLYAVDEGVLSLIGYKTPDPLPVFTAARPLQVATVESREALAKLGLEDLGNLLGLDKGQEGGGGGEGRSARRDFRQSAYFNPTLVTDAEGKAKVSFKIPESLTTYRVMAVATTVDDRYGYGDSRIVTSRRLMARPALPRFLRVGDGAEAGVVVSAKGFGPATVNVVANLSGVELSGEATRSVKLERDQSVEVRFPIAAKTAGRARFRFDVKAEGEHDAVEVEREVELPTSLEAVALYGQTDRAAGEQLGDLSAIRRDVGQLELSVASTALVGLDAGVEQLVEYPYGCTEQLSSRLLPLVPLRELAKEFRFALPKNVDSVVDKTVAEILGRQRGDGGFGMWPDSPESSPWVTSYALWVLHLAKKHGAHVPARAVESARSYVRAYLEQVREDELYRATAAFVVDVLAEVGTPDTGYMSRLYEQRKQLPLFAQAFLLHAMAISKQKSQLVDQLAKELEGKLRLDANSAFVPENLGDDYAVLMDSPARSSALVLRALLAARPSHPLASKLARGLLSVRRGGTWRSTQESAYALLALDDYRRAQEKSVPDYVAKIWLGGAALFEGRMQGRSVEVEREVVPVAKLGTGSDGLLVFEKQGAGTLFYEARLKYARRTLPSEPLDRGFFVQKTLRPVSVEGLPDAIRSIPDATATRFPAGSLVIADLVIVTPSPREFVVLDDPLPAGLEAIDANLSTTAAWLRIAHSGGEPGSADCHDCGADFEDELAHGRAFLDSWYRRELRDDRVLFFVDHMAAGMYHYRYLARATTLGKFVVPPTRAEEMYTPEVFGRTAATSAEVR